MCSRTSQCLHRQVGSITYVTSLARTLYYLYDIATEIGVYVFTHVAVPASPGRFNHACHFGQWLLARY
jgi:hypothetical protein